MGRMKIPEITNKRKICEVCLKRRGQECNVFTDIKYQWSLPDLCWGFCASPKEMAAIEDDVEAYRLRKQEGEYYANA